MDPYPTPGPHLFPSIFPRTPLKISTPNMMDLTPLPKYSHVDTKTRQIKTVKNEVIPTIFLDIGRFNSWFRLPSFT